MLFFFIRMNFPLRYFRILLLFEIAVYLYLKYKIDDVNRRFVFKNINKIYAIENRKPFYHAVDLTADTRKGK